MPSPPSSVIVLDDSSDEEATAEASGRRSAPLLVSSSDESDTGQPSQPKKARVASPKFTFAAEPAARKGLSYQSASSEEEPSDTQEDESDASESSAPRGKQKKKMTASQKKKKNSAGQSSATTDSDDYTQEEQTQLKFAGNDGRMYSDAMSFSELQAQQREFEILQAIAHRASKSAPHNTARRTTTAGTKRKASDAVAATHSSPHSRSKSVVMKKTASPSPFDFDFPGSDEESSSSSSSSSVQEDTRAKSMSLKDVVAQERELARLRKENGKKTGQTAPPKKKPAAKQPVSKPASKPSASKPAASKPAAKQPVPKPAAPKSSVSKPAASKPAAPKPSFSFFDPRKVATSSTRLNGLRQSRVVTRKRKLRSTSQKRLPSARHQWTIHFPSLMMKTSVMTSIMCLARLKP